MEWEDLRLFDNTKSIFLQGRLSYERDETENKVLIQTDKVLLIIPRLLEYWHKSQVLCQLSSQSKAGKSAQSMQEKSNEKGKPGHSEKKQISEWIWE